MSKDAHFPGMKPDSQNCPPRTARGDLEPPKRKRQPTPLRQHFRPKPPVSPRSLADYQDALRILREIDEDKRPVDDRMMLDRLLLTHPNEDEIRPWLEHLEKNPFREPKMAEREPVKAPSDLSASNPTAPGSKASSKPVLDARVPDTWKRLGTKNRKRLLELLSNRSRGDLGKRTRDELTELAGRYPSQQKARDWATQIKKVLKERSDKSAILAQLKQKQSHLLAQAARARQEAEKAEQEVKTLGEEIGKLERELM